MPKTLPTNEVVVRVEIDYDRLAEAIRKAMSSSITVTQASPESAEDAARRMVKKHQWHEGGRVK